MFDFVYLCKHEKRISYARDSNPRPAASDPRTLATRVICRWRDNNQGTIYTFISKMCQFDKVFKMVNHPKTLLLDSNLETKR